MFSSFLYGQIEETINTIENCNIEIENDSTPIINKVRKNTFYLPKGWQGDFYDDNPTLYIKKIIDNDTFNIRANAAWDVYNDPDYIQSMKTENKNIFDINGFSFLPDTISRFYIPNLKLSLRYYEGQKNDFENKWVWTFFISSTKDEVPEVILCELKSIILQFTYYSEAEEN